MKKSLVMLAQVYNPEKYNIANWYASEKLDGMRAFWDGGVSRGCPAVEIPWANCEKHARYKNEMIATGLWSRYGQAIQAPGWWLDKLPRFCLDGELWAGAGKFQTVTSIVRSLGSQRWNEIQYMAFDVPSVFDLFADRIINETNNHASLHGCVDWMFTHAKLGLDPDFAHCSMTMDETVKSRPVKRIQDGEFGILWNPQYRLTGDPEVKLLELTEHLEERRAEGIMLRHPLSMWEPERSHSLLKVKKRHDAEAEVVDYTWGRETDRGSKLLGKMGAMILKMPSGKIFELSGFTDAEREMQDIFEPWNSKSVQAEGEANPGKQVTSRICNPQFPRGSKVTYRYRELTDAGIPKEASFHRKAT